MSFLIILSFALSFMLSNQAVFIISLYLTINVFYSNSLKHIPYVDVLCIGSGFMLRILMGTWAINITPSNWLLLCGTTLSLFLAFSKRKLEMRLYQINKSSFRPVLEKYSNKILSIFLVLTTLLTFYSYINYVYFISKVHSKGSWLFITIPLALLGFIRYSYLIFNNSKYSCPINLFMHDRWLLLDLLLFISVITGVLW